MDFVDIPLDENICEDSHNFTDIKSHEFDDLGTLKHENNVQKIQGTVEELGASLESSRQDENQLIFQMACMKAENMNLTKQLKQANKRNESCDRKSLHGVDSSVSWRTEEGSPSSTTSKLSRSTDCRKHQQDLENALRKRGRKLRRKNQEISCLHQQLTELKEKLLEKERTIEILCVKYLSLKRRKDNELQMLQNKVAHVHGLLGEAYDMTQSLALQDKAGQFRSQESVESLRLEELQHIANKPLINQRQKK